MMPMRVGSLQATYLPRVAGHNHLVEQKHISFTPKFTSIVVLAFTSTRRDTVV